MRTHTPPGTSLAPRRRMPAAASPSPDAAALPVTGAGEGPFAGAHLPALDGIRALAVLLVVAAHTAAAPTFDAASALGAFVIRHGWVGVDLFFVLSGFLITRVLLATRDDRHYFRNFWARRALRVFPLYYAFLAVWLGLLPAVAAGDEVRARIVGTVPWYFTYTFNYLVAARGWDAAIPGTVHLWSLSVEEQFYLLWPFLVRFVSPHRLPVTLAALVVATIGARVGAVLGGLPADAAYVITPLRLDGLLAGAMLAAVAHTTPRERIGRWLSVIGPVSLVLLVATIAIEGWVGRIVPANRGGLVLAAPTGMIRVLVELPLVAGAGAWLVWRGVDSPGSSRLVRALSNRGMTWIGRVSYGVYVLHVPAIVLLERLGAPSEAFGAGGWRTPASWLVWTTLVLATTLAGAAVSWVVLERRALALKRYFAPALPTSAGPTR